MGNDDSIKIKNDYIIQFIDKVILGLKENNIEVSEEKRQQAISMFMNSPKELEIIQNEIYELSQRYIKDYMMRKAKEKAMKEANKESQDMMYNQGFMGPEMGNMSPYGQYQNDNSNTLARKDVKKRVLIPQDKVSSGNANPFLLSLITGFAMGLVSVLAYIFISG